MILVHENEKEIYGDIPRRCLDIVTSVASPNLQLAWDPANFVQVGVRPFTEGYAMLRPHVDYMQIKDALLADALGRGRRRRRRRAAARPSEPFATTASTGSSPSSRTSVNTPRSGRSPDPSFSPKPGRPSPTFSAAKGSSTHECRQRIRSPHPTGPRRCRRYRHACTGR